VDKALQNVIKHDQFVESVEGAAEYVSSHRRQVFIYAGGALLAVAAAYFGWTMYSAKKQERQLALGAAVGITAETESRNAETTKKVTAAFQQVAEKFPGSSEANMSKYLLAAFEMEQGDAAKAEKSLRELLSADKETSNLAKYTLAEYSFGVGKADEAEKLYRELLAAPSAMVPKEQSTLQLARLIAKSKPEEARKLLEPLRSARTPISSPALEILGTLPPAPGTPVKK
jgi:predicted negative regulator of RcsB-dependent stress response